MNCLDKFCVQMFNLTRNVVRLWQKSDKSATLKCTSTFYALTNKVCIKCWGWIIRNLSVIYHAPYRWHLSLSSFFIVVVISLSLNISSHSAKPIWIYEEDDAQTLLILLVVTIDSIHSYTCDHEEQSTWTIQRLSIKIVECVRFSK